MLQNIETNDQKAPVFVTRFETSADGIKSTTSKIADVEGVLIEEVLSEPEQEKESRQGDVVIEEVQEGERNVHNYCKSRFKQNQIMVKTAANITFQQFKHNSYQTIIVCCFMPLKSNASRGLL